MRKGFWRAALALGTAAIVIAAVAAYATATPAPAVTADGIVPSAVSGSSEFADCTTAPTGQQHIFGLKVEKSGAVSNYNGTFDKTNTSHTHGSDNPLRVTISDAKVVNGLATFAWSANMPVDYVFVKAGNGANMYDYSAYGWGGHPATGPWADSGLVSPKDSISHVLFCTVKKLRVEKTAVASYVHELQWQIQKRVKTSGDFATSASLSLLDGGSGPATWQVSADQVGSVDRDFRVAGVITVLDSSPFDASGVLDESLTNVTFSGCSAVAGTTDKASFSVAKGATITCAYSAPLDSKTDGTNTVDADPSTPDWMASTSASKAYAFGAPTSTKNATVRWSDSNGKSKTGISADDTASYDTTQACPSSRAVVNTVSLYGDGDVKLGSDTATLEISCTAPKPLVVTKTADGTFERTWSWTIDKGVKTSGDAYSSSASLDLPAGGSGVAHYKVKVTGTPADGNYAVSGVIHVQNPNNVPIEGVSVTDALPGASVDCGQGSSTGLTIAADTTLDCSYTVALDKVATQNTASAAVAGHPELGGSTGAVAIAFGAPTEKAATVDVTDAFDGGAPALVEGGQLTASGSGPFVTDLTYDRTLSCGTSHLYPNTAAVSPGGHESKPFGESSASVDVHCAAPLALQVSKTAVPSFTRTWDWTVAKTADQAQIDLKDGGTGSTNWNVTLAPKEGSPVDSAWRLSGTITVTNPNAFAVDGVDVSDSLGGNVTCPTATIAAGGTLHCTYSVRLESGESGTNAATATTTTTTASGPVPSGQGSAPYAFTEPTSTVNENVDVVDTNGKTWSDRTEGFVASYSTGSLPCRDATYTNTARVIGDEGAILDEATATVRVSCSTTPPQPPAPVIDIGVTKSATTPTKLNGNVTYTIVVSSLGPDAANGVQVADPAPSGIGYLSASSSDAAVACAVVQSGALVSCSRPGAFAPGQSFVVTVVGKATQTGTLTNTVTVSTPGDSQASNNQASASTLVVAPVTPPTPKPKPKPKPKPAVCSMLTVARKTVTVAKPGKLTLTVKAGGKPVAGTPIRIVGAGVDRVAKTGRNGIAVVTITASRPGILVVSIAGRKGCNTARVGVVGAFEPPVTG